MLSVDLSNYSGPVSQDQARDLFNAGVRKAIVQLVRPDINLHREQIPALVGTGIDVEAYVYVWYSAGEQFIRDRVAWACREAADFPQIKFIWADCEQADDTGFDYLHADQQYVVNMTRAAIDTIGAFGYQTGIYTARWWWIPATGDSAYFSGVFPLWNANYDHDPDIDQVNYGGWSVPKMEQFHGSTTFAGVPMVDLNSYVVAETIRPAAADPRLTQARDLLSAVLEGR